MAKPIVKGHGGDWLKEIGDGLLLTFDSIREAITCAIEIQAATLEKTRISSINPHYWVFF